MSGYVRDAGNHVGPEGKVCDLASCARMCMSTSGCMSFAYNFNDREGRNCWLKDKQLTGDEALASDGTNGWRTFYRIEDPDYVNPEPFYPGNTPPTAGGPAPATAAPTPAPTTTPEHDPTKCLENGRPDNDCCALQWAAGCS